MMWYDQEEATVICWLMFPVWRTVHTLGRDTRIASVCLAEDGRQGKGSSFTTSAEPRLGNQLPWGRKRTSEAMHFLAFRFTVQARDVDSLEKLLWFHSSPSMEFTEQRREFTSLSGFPLGWCCLYGCIWSVSWVRIKQLCHFSSSVLSLSTVLENITTGIDWEGISAHPSPVFTSRWLWSKLWGCRWDLLNLPSSVARLRALGVNGKS